MPKEVLLAIDQGTSSSRAILFDRDMNIILSSQKELASHYPEPSWVEQKPEAIWHSVLYCCQEIVNNLDKSQFSLVGIGITNQRETCLVWDRETGEPIYDAIVWQDRRTLKQCHHFREDNLESMISNKTGLLLDPYFSATKLAWILDNVDGARAKANAGKLLFGTIDTFLLWKFTEGKVHATDITNASRTSLFNISTHQWDPELLELFTIPESILPSVHASNADFGSTRLLSGTGELPISSLVGDQQAALVGQGCFKKGELKATYGTGCFAMINTGQELIQSDTGLLSTIAYQLGTEVYYALEGSIFSAGSAIKWLRDNLQIISKASETETIARQLKSNGGVYFIPSFNGLGAPYWEDSAKGAIVGLTFNTTREHITRAALESIVYQSADLLDAMKRDGIAPSMIKVDGGVAQNEWFCQFLSDILEIDVERPVVTESTALGAAALAGLGLNLYDSVDKLPLLDDKHKVFKPAKDEQQKRLMEEWHQAVNRVF